MNNAPGLIASLLKVWTQARGPLCIGPGQPCGFLEEPQPLRLTRSFDAQYCWAVQVSDEKDSLQTKTKPCDLVMNNVIHYFQLCDICQKMTRQPQAGRIVHAEVAELRAWPEEVQL